MTPDFKSKLLEWREKLKDAPDRETIIHGYGLTPQEGITLIDIVLAQAEGLELVAYWDAPEIRKPGIQQIVLARETLEKTAKMMESV